MSSEFFPDIQPSRCVHAKEGRREAVDIPLSFHKGREGRDAVSDEMVSLPQDVQVHLGGVRLKADDLHLKSEPKTNTSPSERRLLPPVLTRRLHMLLAAVQEAPPAGKLLALEFGGCFTNPPSL